jgi:hypothetical protein
MGGEPSGTGRLPTPCGAQVFPDCCTWNGCGSGLVPSGAQVFPDFSDTRASGTLPRMWRLFGSRKQATAQDQPRTRPDELEGRIEALEARVRRLVDDQAELEDGIARRLDKWRKRVERDTPPDEVPKDVDHATGGPSRSSRPLAPLGRVLSFDALSVRRGRGTFPGGGR